MAYPEPGSRACFFAFLLADAAADADVFGEWTVFAALPCAAPQGGDSSKGDSADSREAPDFHENKGKNPVDSG